MIRDILKVGLTLALVCLVASGGLAFTYSLTRDQIRRQIWEEQIKGCRKVLRKKGAEKFRLQDKVTSEAKKKEEIVDKIFEGLKGNEVVGYAVQVLPKGYGGPIKMVVGLSKEGRVLDIKISEQRETPGLGGRIEERSFQKQFIGKGKESQFEVGKDIDAISGATISSKGVAKGVKVAVEVFEKYLKKGGAK